MSTVLFKFNPKPVLYLTGVSMIFCIPMIALTIVNFGMLSIWLNATVAFVILLHHFSFMAVTWISRKHASYANIVAIEDDEMPPLALEDLEPPMPCSLLNIIATTFLCIITTIAFSIMVDITTRGGIKSTLPAERIGSHKWNIKIQIAQTTVLGTELVTLLAVLAICAVGRNRFCEAKEKREAVLEYGGKLPEV
jgi:hypothetical protein